MTSECDATPPPRHVCAQWSQCHSSNGLFPCCFEILSFSLSSLSVSLICLSLFLLAYFLVDEWLTVNSKGISKRKVCKENKQNAASAVTGELLEMSGHDRLPLKQRHCLWSEQHASGGRHFTWRGCRRGSGRRARSGRAVQVGAASPGAGSCFAGLAGQAEQYGLTVTEGSYSRSGHNHSDSESIDNIYQVNGFTSKQGRFFRIMLPRI